MPVDPTKPCSLCGAERAKYSSYCAKCRRETRRKAAIKKRAAKTFKELGTDELRELLNDMVGEGVRPPLAMPTVGKGDQIEQVSIGDADKKLNVLSLPSQEDRPKRKPLADGTERAPRSPNNRPSVPEPPSAYQAANADVGLSAEQIVAGWRMAVHMLLDIMSRDGVRRHPATGEVLTEISAGTRVTAANAFFRAVEPMQFDRSELAQKEPAVRIEYVEPQTG